MQPSNSSASAEKHSSHKLYITCEQSEATSRKKTMKSRCKSSQKPLEQATMIHGRQWQQQVVVMASASWLLIALSIALTSLSFVLGASGRITFEKMTNRDYSGLTYYTIQNVSLFECLGWCKEESSCTSAVFSFVVNPFAALQETTCMLQNETQARQTAYLRQMPGGEHATVVAHPQKATNLYFFNKIDLQTDAVCSRLWAFERFPNRRLRQRDRPAFHAPSKEACQAACMNEQRFVCRSLEYNYISQQCSLNGYDRRSPMLSHHSGLGLGFSSGSVAAGGGELLELAGTDYFENACLLGEDICNESRVYDYAKIGLPLPRVAHFVELNYYPDKEMLVKSQAGCVRACTIEHEFICRSILYRSSFKQGQPNCALYHLDQRTFPDGAETFMSHVMQPLLDSGETSAVYLEAVCNDTLLGPSSGSSISSTLSSSSPMGAGTTITMPPTQITIIPNGIPGGQMILQPSGGGGGGGGGGNHHLHQSGHSNHSSSMLDQDSTRFISSSSPMSSSSNGGTSTLSPLVTSASSSLSTTIRLPTTFIPPTNPLGGPSSSSSSSSSSIILGPSGQPIPTHVQIQDPYPMQSISRRPTPPSHVTIMPSSNGGHGIEIRPAPPPFDPPGSPSITGPNGPNGIPPTNHDQNCDAHGFCYDVTLKCTDTKMVVNVKSQRPFFGRIYALGRSETCNANIKNQNQFQLDMYLTGQECNTQSLSGTYTNTIVLQHHNVVLTKADKVYHVRCTYETAPRNVSFGMMPVKDMFEVDVDRHTSETISITASSDAPLPKINILTLDGKEASTVRIGDRLTFRIEIPDNTPYGIFARSCIAMAKDARSTFEIIDEHGCPVDHTIFPNFIPVSNGNALESNYEAFRFTESYGVIFQCNVKYCIGKCEPVPCGIGRDTVEAWGRKKRSISGKEITTNGTGKQLGDDMTLSREIVVLDLKEKSDQSGQESSVDSSLAGAQRLKSSGDQSNPSVTDSSSNSASQLDNGNNQKHCLSSQSLFVLICSIGLFFMLYVCVVAYFFARRDPKISPIKHQYH